MELHPGQNTGVIAQSPKPGDFVAGAETGVMTQTHVLTGDWRPFLPTDETQLLKVGTQAYLETNSCVSFSGDNLLEIFGNQQMSVSAWDQGSVQWLKDNGYIDANGRLNFSDRFTAKMSGTDPANGNSLPKVWDSRRNDGMVPEALWPMPSETVKGWIAAGKQFTLQDLRDLYYAEIPQSVKDLGLEFKKRFEVLYEFVKYPGYGTVDSMRQSLKMAPLQVATAVCTGWNTDNPINACGAGSQHATCIVNIEPDGTFDDYDHYQPFQKRFTPAYDITYAMRAVMYPKPPAPPTPPGFHYVFNVNLGYGMGATSEVQKLQEALQYLKRADGTPYLKVGVFGPYGPATRAAVALFQTDNGIPDPQPGEHFGPLSRAKMNAKL